MCISQLVGPNKMTHQMPSHLRALFQAVILAMVLPSDLHLSEAQNRITLR